MAELTADGINLRRTPNREVWFWLARGWRDDPAAVRGKDDVVPGASGRLPRGRKADARRIELRGQVKGSDDAAFLALVEELEPTLFDLEADPWPLVLGDGYRGLGVGQTATINVRTVGVTPDPGFLSYRRVYVVELESVDSPPSWVIAP